MTALAVDTPAKLNLYLAVCGRRPDGYHELVTVLHALALCDTLSVERCAGEPSLTISSDVVTGLPVHADADNLVLRAARAFETATGRAPCARFHLHKRIPAGGGLGGGSSDAAAALRLLNALHDHPLDAAALHAVAASSGMDVPFFVRGGTQIGTGAGAELRTFPEAPHWHFLLVLPPIGTHTAAVYKNLAAHWTEGPAEATFAADKIPTHKDLALPMGFRNDLERSACQLHPELADLRREIAGSGYPAVRMTGSGSTFFLAFDEEVQCAHAKGILGALQDRGVVLVQTESSALHDDPRSVTFPIRADHRGG